MITLEPFLSVVGLQRIGSLKLGVFVVKLDFLFQEQTQQLQQLFFRSCGNKGLGRRGSALLMQLEIGEERTNYEDFVARTDVVGSQLRHTVILPATF